MKRKILKVFLVVTCQLILLTGMCFASEVNEKYFTPKPFKAVSTWVKDVNGEVEKKSLDEVEKAYEEAYNLEKEMKYFNADKKWRETTRLVDEIYETLRDYYREYDYDDDELDEIEEALDDFISDINGYSEKRDYRYGFLSFDEAYELELKDFINLMPKDKREAFKAVLKERYEEMKTTYKKLLNLIEYKDMETIGAYSNIQKNNEKYEEYERLNLQFGQKRDAVNALIEATYNQSKQQYLVFTKNDIYHIQLVYLDSEKLNRFLNEEEVIDIIGKKDIEKLKKLSKEVQEADNDVEEDDYLDEIEEMLLDYFPKQKEYYKGKNNKNLEKIKELYDEIDEDD